MSEHFEAESQFAVLVDDGQHRWFNKKTVLLLTIIITPIIVFSGIYILVINGSDRVKYPKSEIFQVPGSWLERALFYNNNRHKQYVDPLQAFALKRKKIQDVDPEFKLVCYYNFPPSVEPTDHALNILNPNQLDPFLCTHIIVGFVAVQNSSINLNENQMNTLRELVALRKQNGDLKIMLSVGGGGTDENSGFPEMVLNHANRKLFIKSCFQYLKKFSLDGVDLDWEFPSEFSTYDVNQRMHFTQLLEEFRAEIWRQQKRHQFLLSIAIGAPVFIVDAGYDVPYINQFVDFVNLMSYDYHFYTRETPFTGYNAPLYKSRNEIGYFATLNVNYSANYLLYKGLDKEKIIIGLPTYGHTYRLTNVNNNEIYAPAKGVGKLGSNGFVDYNQICRFLELNHVTSVFDTVTKCPYATKAAEWVSFDSTQSLSFKAEFIRDEKFGGAMIYSLNADDYVGSCQMFSSVKADAFPLTKKVKEILSGNYSIF